MKKILEKQPINVDILENIYNIIKPGVSKIINRANKRTNPKWDNYTSKEFLDQLDDQEVPKSSHHNLVRIKRFIDIPEIMWQVQTAFPKKRIILSGDFYYPPTGFMGWHTNHDAPCDRLYINYASEDKKSFFRYYWDGKIVTDYDNKGMNARMCTCPGERPYFWHCVGSECDRISLGFKLS